MKARLTLKARFTIPLPSYRFTLEQNFLPIPTPLPSLPSLVWTSPDKARCFSQSERALCENFIIMGRKIPLIEYRCAWIYETLLRHLEVSFNKRTHIPADTAKNDFFSFIVPFFLRKVPSRLIFLSFSFLLIWLDHIYIYIFKFAVGC